MKTSKDFLDEAHAAVPKISPAEGIARHAAGKAVFIDVRDSSEIAQTGTIPGALKISRGFIEFAADPETAHHNPALAKDAELVLICGAGGQAALAGKTLKDMGYTSVVNVGGIGDWQKAGGKLE